ncbi:DUF4440 domain-containing protein [Selenomonas ruminantium]|uniref:DUF4440 domain-containing protein n=1 Tax=Selenomonas ruminantium TaxID=971 RepID=UPI0035242CEB
MERTRLEKTAYEKAALDKWFKGDTSGYRNLWSKKNFSYFDGAKEHRVDSYEEICKALELVEGQLFAEKYDFCCPRVQLGKDMAVLTYQLFADTKLFGKPFSMQYNCIEIFQQEEAGWQVIHSTWSFILPMTMDFSAFAKEEIL